MTMLSTSMKLKTDMKITRSILLIAFLMLFYRAFGQPAERLIRIQITPNHTDWLYKPGEKIKFSITVLKNNVPIPDTEIRYQISEDMMKPHKEGILQAEKGTATVEAKTMEKPGFLRCQAFVKYGGREYQSRKIKTYHIIARRLSKFLGNSKTPGSKDTNGCTNDPCTRTLYRESECIPCEYTEL